MADTSTSMILTLSPAAYQEIRAKLLEAGDRNRLRWHRVTREEIIDMHGIAIQDMNNIAIRRIPEDDEDDG